MPFCGTVTEEFVDYESVSVSYDQRGLANISLVVYSPDNILRGKYNVLDIGSKHFEGVTLQANPQVIEGSAAYMFHLTVIATAN